LNQWQVAESVSLLQQWATDQRLGSREARHLNQAIEKFERSDSVLRGQHYKKIIALEAKMRQLTTDSRDNSEILDLDLKHLLSLQPLSTVEQITLHLINIFRRNMDRFTSSKLSSLLNRPSVSAAFFSATESGGNEDSDNDNDDDDLEQECVKLIREALATFPTIRDSLTLLHDVWCALVDTKGEPAKPLQVELATHGNVFNVDVLSIIVHLAKGPTQFHLYDLAKILSPSLSDESINVHNKIASRLHVAESSVDALSRIMQFNAKFSSSSNSRVSDNQTSSRVPEIPTAKYLSIFESPLLAIPTHLLDSWHLEISTNPDSAKEFLGELMRWYDVELWLLTALMQYCFPLKEDNLTWGEFVVHRHIFHQVTVLLSLMYGKSETLPNLFWFSRCNLANRNGGDTDSIADYPDQFDTLEQLIDWLDSDPRSPLPYRIHVTRTHPSLKRSNYETAEELVIGRLLSSTELNCRLDQPVSPSVRQAWTRVTNYIRNMLEKRQLTQVHRLVAWLNTKA
jgi:hypothetical protein